MAESSMAKFSGIGDPDPKSDDIKIRQNRGNHTSQEKSTGNNLAPETESQSERNCWMGKQRWHY